MSYDAFLSHTGVKDDDALTLRLAPVVRAGQVKWSSLIVLAYQYMQVLQGPSEITTYAIWLFACFLPFFDYNLDACFQLWTSREVRCVLPHYL
jgi:hypothetical protein